MASSSKPPSLAGSTASASSSTLSNRQREKQPLQPRTSMFSITSVEDSSDEDDLEGGDDASRFAGRSSLVVKSKKRDKHVASSARRKRKRDSEPIRREVTPRVPIPLRPPSPELPSLQNGSYPERPSIPNSTEQEANDDGTGINGVRDDSQERASKRKRTEYNDENAIRANGSSSHTTENNDSLAQTLRTAARAADDDSGDDFIVQVTTRNARAGAGRARDSDTVLDTSGRLKGVRKSLYPTAERTYSGESRDSLTVADAISINSDIEDSQASQSAVALSQETGQRRRRRKHVERSLTPVHDDGDAYEDERPPLARMNANRAQGIKNPPPTPGASGKENRLKSQVDKLKRQLNERNSAFDEISEAYTNVQRRAEKAELQVVRLRQEHSNHLASSSGDALQRLQATVDRLTAENMTLRNDRDGTRHDERAQVQELRQKHNAEIAGRNEEIREARRQAAQAKREAEQDRINLKAEHAKACQELQVHFQVEHKKFVAQYKSTEAQNIQAAVYEAQRIMDGVIDELQTENARLKAHASLASQRSTTPGMGVVYRGTAASYPSAGSSPPAAMSSPHDASEVFSLRRKLSQMESLQTAREHQRKTVVEGLRRQLAERDQRVEDKYTALETARSKMEIECGNWRMKYRTAAEQLAAVKKNYQRLEAHQPEYERFRLEHPTVVQELQTTKEELDAISKENASYRAERSLYVSQLGSVRGDVQAARAEVAKLQAGKLQMAAESDRARNILTSVAQERKHHHAERTQLRDKIRKLTKRLKMTKSQAGYGENGANGIDGVHDVNGSDHGEDLSDEGSMTDDSLPTGSANYHDRELEFHDGPHRRGSIRSGDYSMDDLPIDANDINNFDLFDQDINLQDPVVPAPPIDPLVAALRQRVEEAHSATLQTMTSAWQQKRRVRWPNSRRERRPSTRVPKQKGRIYVRSECHTPYVPDENVSDSDDEFLEWESEAYARSQAGNPDRAQAVVNTCWNRHILDCRGTRIRSRNLEFCTTFAEDYAGIIASSDAQTAFLKHILELVTLGQLTPDEGGSVVRTFHNAVDALRGA